MENDVKEVVMIEKDQKNQRWSSRIRSQPMFDILKQVKDREIEYPGIIHLEIGDTNGFSNDPLKDFIEQSLRQLPFTYSPSVGESFLRESLSVRMTSELQRSVGTSEITVGPANSLITQSLAAVCSEGDLVLIPDPGFPTYTLASEFLSLDAQPYSVYSNGGPQIQSIEEIQNLIGNRRIKAVVICNPSNPLGYAFDWKYFDELLAIAEEHRAVAIFDETYVNLVCSDKLFRPYEYPEELSIRLRSLSKEFAAPALRIGWAVSSPEVAAVISRFSSMTYSCLPSFIQIGVANYLNSDEASRFAESVRNEMRDRFQFFEDRSNEVGAILSNKPNAGFYSFVSIPDERRVFQVLLEKHNVAVCPGSAFGSKGINSIRLSLAGPRNLVYEGINRVLAGLMEIQTKGLG